MLLLGFIFKFLKKSLNKFCHVPPVSLVPPVPPVPLVSPVPALPILPAFSTLSPVPLVPLVPQFKIQNSKFKICQFPSHYLERIIGLKNAYLYGR